MKKMEQQLQAIAVEEITRAGWTPDRLLPHVLVKDYATAVGLKGAVVRADEMKSEGKIWLNGSYWSEGNNALSACFAFIPVSADKDAVITQVKAFLAEVDQRIAGTYAVKLLNGRKEHAVTP